MTRGPVALPDQNRGSRFCTVRAKNSRPVSVPRSCRRGWRIAGTLPIGSADRC
jgi:hypothetical protein